MTDPTHVVVLDLYGFVSVGTWEEFSKRYSFTAPEHIPMYKGFYSEGDALAYRDALTQGLRGKYFREMVGGL